ncbi:hypothetical protein Leryth_002770 [Lithospermum erythrorhizon]|uniref:Glycosyltransferase n=1 Tax=Lithospermum erythrorhizon TaxID=34254 RepID=A0AAV3NWL3_LITER|nr:hypothetical protein Leryth_002770 [Lithospermum erythrorhizon]
MDNLIPTTMLRKKIWLVFFAMFVFWYLLLYGAGWESLKPSSHNQENILKVSSDTHQDEDGFSKIDMVSTDESRNASNVSDNDQNPSVYVFDPNETKKSCEGRYIYVHELPSRFNNDLLQQCKSLSKWENMCKYLANSGLGPDLGNPQRLFLSSGWYETNQFSLEVIFHNKMKQYECLTDDSSKAAGIFVPYYPGLDVARYLFSSYNMSVRDAASLDLVKWLREKPEWKSLWGRDHFMVAGRISWDFRRVVDEDSAWGNKLMLLPETQNMTMLTIESSPWNKNDFAIPYPTYFHPAKDDDVLQWQNKMRRTKRRVLFSFVGGARPKMERSIRGEIMDQCVASRRKCRLLQCQEKSNKCLRPAYVMKNFQISDFCLQPSGDSFTRRSTFDSILAGCIPVFFSPGSAYVQYLWHLPKEYTKYSVLISEEDVKAKKVNIENVLSRIPKSKVAAMREEVIKLIPKVVYADPRFILERVEDAFDLTVNGVLERVNGFRKEIREGKSISLSFDEESSWKYYTFGLTGKHEWDHFFLRTKNRTW